MFEASAVFAIKHHQDKNLGILFFLAPGTEKRLLGQRASIFVWKGSISFHVCLKSLADYFTIYQYDMSYLISSLPALSQYVGPDLETGQTDMHMGMAVSSHWV